MGVAYNPNIVTDGLVFCVDAANARSYPGTGTTWTDRSANGNDGTLTNGPTFDSANGGSIVFDGSDDQCHVSSDALNPSDGTVCIWLNSSAGYGDIYNTHSGGWNQNTLWVDGGILRLRISDGTGNPGDVTYSGSVFDGTSRFICAQWKHNGERSLWVDSVKVAFLGSTKLFVPGSTWEIAYKSWQARRFSGNIYAIQSYNRNLSADEVRRNYNATKGRFNV